MKLKPNVPSPPGYEMAYALSYQLAFDKLSQSDLMELSRKSGASIGSDSTLILDFLNIPVLIDIKRRTIEPFKNSLPITDQLVILHYLVTAGGQPAIGKLISFKDLPEGSGYFPTFYKRAISPIIRKFGNSAGDLPTAAALLGGVSATIGDSGISIKVLPRVTLNWGVWQGDGILPPEGSILFDSGIKDYLPIEDIAALCHSIAIRLCS